MDEGKKFRTAPTRRDFLKGRIANRNFHIASILVQAWPEKLTAIEARLTQLSGVESHGSNEAGKLILTVETDDDSNLVDTMHSIEAVDGVIVASLVYHQVEAADD